MVPHSASHGALADGLPRGPGDAPLLQLAVDVPAYLDAASAGDFARDRQFDPGEERNDQEALLRRWWAERAPAGTEPSAGTRLCALRTLIRAALVVVGVVAGAGLAATVLRYDGSEPVNVLVVLAVLPGLQLLMLLLTGAWLVAGQTGLARAQQVLGVLIPARLVAGALQGWLGRDGSGAALLGDGTTRRLGAGSFRTWQLLTLTQESAAAFNLAALVTATVLVAFTDLAFGWSSTLEVSAADIAAFAESVAAPWRDLLPFAVPDADLVERSRYFRLEGAGTSTPPPTQLTGWWPFLLLSLLVYGLLPRVILLALARAGLDRATHALLFRDTRVMALLDRLRRPVVSTGSGGEGMAREIVEEALPAEGEGPPWSDEDVLVLWAGAPVPPGAPHGPALSAGGTRSVADDEAVVREAAAGTGPVRVVCAAWEPPLLEFEDFLDSLRRAAGPRRPVVLHAVDENGEPADPALAANWYALVRRRRDLGLLAGG